MDNYTLAKNIVENMRRIGQIWADLDFIEAHQAAPDKTAGVARQIDEMSLAEIISFCFTCDSTLAKLRAAVKKEQLESKKIALQQRISKMEGLRKELTDIRDGITEF